MQMASPELIWELEDEKLAQLIENAVLTPEKRHVHFYAPSFVPYKNSSFQSLPSEFPTISITGKECSLRCKHCNGNVLGTMLPATTPADLLRICQQLKNQGAIGCLISGGCMPDGSLPLSKFVPSIAEIKQKLELTVLVHTGIMKPAVAKALREAGVDAALIDIIGSDETIEEITGLRTTTRGYEEALAALQDSGIKYVPHVIVGMHYGKLRGEFNALRIISHFRPESLVIIAFMPIRGTQMERVYPPRPIDIARVIAIARRMFPSTPLALGCMRPGGEHRSETDVLSIKAGADAIAFPSGEAIRFAEKNGYKTMYSHVCCSQVYADIGIIRKTQTQTGSFLAEKYEQARNNRFQNAGCTENRQNKFFSK